MTKFESQPELPKLNFSVMLELEVSAVGYREAAEQARAILMSDACPQKFVVTDLDGPPLTSQAWVDLSDD
jgi:hypothetical protein